MIQEPIYIYNSETRTKQEFKPISSPFVGMYVCGPTVYSNVHLGNCRTFISFDIIFRYLNHKGYKVRYVRNITDAGHLEGDADRGEDKIAKKAKLAQLEPMEIVQQYTVDFRNVMNTFNVLPPSIEPTATGHIIEQIEMTKKILENGYAYEVNGSIYFDVDKYNKEKNYGVLSGRNIDDLLANTRDLDGQEEKRSPLDFALWIKANPEHLMQWPSPWGMGFPGWHLECSAMSNKYLGSHFDIHGGGIDLIPTHHTNEIAQNTACCGHEPANYWIHTNMLTVNGQKMSKSLGNSFLPHELFTGTHPLLDRGYSPMAVRFFMLQAHYRSTLDFSNAALESSEKGFKRMMTAVATLSGLSANADTSSVNIEELKNKCYTAMNDDFNTPIAIAELFEGVRIINSIKAGTEQINQQDLDALKALFNDFIFSIFGLLPEEESNENLGKVVDLLIEMRNEAKAKKDYAGSDAIRNKLQNIGIQLKDGKEGTSWTTA